MDIFTSPGGYILGEESALIECMEGHRGEPRNKPPFPGVAGLWGKPTLMNSVETFAHVPVIAERGAEWWKAQGVNGGTGLKFFAVSGHVEKPDVYCVPMGTTTRELIELAGGVSEGRELLAFQPGGASSNFLGPDGLDVPLDFGPLAEAGSMLGSGAVVVIAEGTDLLAAATNVLRFFRNESCGKCVPCRVGSTKAHAILAELVESGGGPEDVDDRIVELEATMRLTSICGLGQVALGPAISVLGLKRGGTEARPHPRPRAADRPRPATVSRSRTTPLAAAGQREFFTVRTVSEALTGFRPARRTAVETVALDDALGRVPAEPLSAPHALPGFARATVDGFAVRAADTYGASEGLPSYLDVAGEVRMGEPPEVEVRPGTAVAIATGAPLPPGADAVVKVEHTQAATAELLEVLRPATPGEGMVRADEDAAPGAELVRAGPPAARPGPRNARRRRPDRDRRCTRARA